ncbi:DUF6228 family protein [Nocardioides rotundus]|uniref:DUF6228 family protein n=1 Tax=Nocardioides rotundus TaxID=1774216 RepID=UPI001CBEF1CE|nr:DUF6228 family protein [Nocardioides rotundus]UAL30699.1 DUF6228 family protein [Nocardioides rotundus]
MARAEIFDGRARLTFAEPVGSGSVVDYLTVRVEGPDLSASRQVYAGWESGFSGLAVYFETLVASWRGWDGEQVFESIEHDLRIVATHDGHVHLEVRLRESTEARGWQVRAELRIEAGEQLASASRDVAALVRR